MRYVRTVHFFAVPIEDVAVGYEPREHVDAFTGERVLSWYVTAPWLRDIAGPAMATFGCAMSEPTLPSIFIYEPLARWVSAFDSHWIDDLFGQNAAELLAEDRAVGSPEGAAVLRDERRQIFTVNSAAVEQFASHPGDADTLTARWRGRDAQSRAPNRTQLCLERADLDAIIKPLAELCTRAMRANDVLLVMVQ